MGDQRLEPGQGWYETTAWAGCDGARWSRQTPLVRNICADAEALQARVADAEHREDRTREHLQDAQDALRAVRERENTAAVRAGEALLRADRLEDALRDRERILARLLQLADAWDALGVTGPAATVVRQTIRGDHDG